MKNKAMSQSKINKLIEAAPIMQATKKVRTRRTPAQVSALLEKVSKLLAKGKTQKFISEKLDLTVSYTQYLASKIAKVETESVTPSVTNEMLMEVIGSLFGKIKKGFQNKLQVSVNEELVLLEKVTPKKFLGITYSKTVSCEFVVRVTFSYGKEVVIIDEQGEFNKDTLQALKVWLYSIQLSSRLVNKVIDFYQRKLAEQNKKEEEVLKKKREDDSIPNFDFGVRGL